MVLLQHAVGGVKLLHVGVVGVEVGGEGGVALRPTVLLVRFTVFPATLLKARSKS